MPGTSKWHEWSQCALVIGEAWDGSVYELKFTGVGWWEGMGRGAAPVTEILQAR